MNPSQTSTHVTAILPEHLPASMRAAEATRAGARVPAGEDLRDEIKSLERTPIVEALERTGGNQRKTSALTEASGHGARGACLGVTRQGDGASDRQGHGAR